MTAPLLATPPSTDSPVVSPFISVYSYRQGCYGRQEAMPSKYDALNAHTELEPTLAADLKAALGKRGLTVTHSGEAASHAPAGVADIIVVNRQSVVTFEATKSRGAAQDRELNSIRDHLNGVKDKYPGKRCYCVFTSPTTSKRMLEGIRDHNQQRAAEGKNDLRILPLAFDSLELWLTRLQESEADFYPFASFLELFKHHADFIDDLRIRKLLAQNVFPNDAELAANIEAEETERDQATLESLIKDLTRMENHMRENGIAAGAVAIDTLIYLVFLKLYEEKRERDKGFTNRLRTVDAFESYRQDSVDAPTRADGRAIQKRFGDIAKEGEFIQSRMFAPTDHLPDSVRDSFIINYAIPNLFNKYHFAGTRIDALGAVYEVLAQRADKDVRVGQFFTPENVVRFMVQLAELSYDDVLLDPACGTGRFLIYSMDDMLRKVEAGNVRNKSHERKEVRLHRLFGVDIDPRIARLAKMNMWFHGDGKSNILGGPEHNGLLLHRTPFNGRQSYDNGFDAVLTRPC